MMGMVAICTMLFIVSTTRPMRGVVVVLDHYKFSISFRGVFAIPPSLLMRLRDIIVLDFQMA